VESVLSNLETRKLGHRINVVENFRLYRRFLTRLVLDQAEKKPEQAEMKFRA
jgi:hypothetical protein